MPNLSERKTISIKVSQEQRTICFEALNIASEESEISNRGDALTFVCRRYLEFQYGKDASGEPREVLIPEVMDPAKIEEFKKLSSICERGLLRVIDGTPFCGQRTYPSGLKTQTPFIYSVKALPNYGQIMSHEDIITTCDLCKQSFAESGKIKELIDTLTQELNENREAVLYFCRHEDLMAEVFTAFANAKFFCPFNNRNVTISHTCLESECTNLHISRILLPPRIPPSQGGEES